jgi:hypothetical protein
MKEKYRMVGTKITSIRKGYECQGIIVASFVNHDYEIKPIIGSKIKDNFIVHIDEIK